MSTRAQAAPGSKAAARELALRTRQRAQQQQQQQPQQQDARTEYSWNDQQSNAATVAYSESAPPPEPATSKQQQSHAYSSAASSIEASLQSTLATKASQLANSKLELARSLAATRELERRFAAEREALKQAERWERERNRPNAEYWNPFGAEEGGPRGGGGYQAEEKESTPQEPHPWRRFADVNTISQTIVSSPLASPASTRSSKQSKKRQDPAGMSTADQARSRAKQWPAQDSATKKVLLHSERWKVDDQHKEDVVAEHVLKKLATKKTVLDLFRNYDVHCTGAVNSNEFASGLMQAGLDLTPPQVAGLIAKLDRENRGEVRYINLIAHPEDTFTAVNSSDPTALPERLFVPAPAPVNPAVYVPIPPYDTVDPAVDEARRSRSQQSRALAINRVVDRGMRMPDGSFQKEARNTPEYFAVLTKDTAPTAKNYWARPYGFKEKAYSHSLGPSNIVDNPLANPFELRKGNSVGWGGTDADGPADPTPSPTEFSKDYSSSLLDPTSIVGGSLRSISERVFHEPVRFVAAMRSMDGDKDNRVTHGEFVSALEKLGVNIPQWRMGDLLKAVDRHGTGSVAYKQVGELLKQYSEAGLQAQRQYQASLAASDPSSTSGPLHPSFVPSSQIPIHAFPSWLPSTGVASNLEKWTQARKIEKEWEERKKQELKDQQARREAAQQQERQEEYERTLRVPLDQEKMKQAYLERVDRAQHQWDESSPESRPEKQWTEGRPHENPSSVFAQWQSPPHEEGGYEQPYPSPQSSNERGRSYTPQEQPPQERSNERQEYDDSRQQQQQQQQEPQQAAPPRAHYPYPYRTTDENLNLLQEHPEAVHPHQVPKERKVSGNKPIHSPAGANSGQEPFQAQEGTSLPVLEIEYPKQAPARPGTRNGLRGNTPLEQQQRAEQRRLHDMTPVELIPRAGRSRSNSVTSVRSDRSTRSTRSQTPSQRGGNGSRRGSFSQAPRPEFQVSSSRRGSVSQQSESGGRRMMGSDAGRYWGGEGSAGQETPGGSRRRSASASSSDRRGGHDDRNALQHSNQAALAPEQYGSSADTQLIKILRLSLAPPLSKKARNSLGGRGGQEGDRGRNNEQQQHSTDASPSPGKFEVHHAASASPPFSSPAGAGASASSAMRGGAWAQSGSQATPRGDGRSRSSSISSTMSETPAVHHDRQTGMAYEDRSAAPHSYGLSYRAWSDRRARDWVGSFVLG